MFKSIRLYRAYRKLLRENEKNLFENFNLKIDQVGRIYTIIHVAPQADTYGPKDGPRITKSLLQTWLKKLDAYLIEIGLKEYTAVQEITEIDEMNYLFVMKFKFFNAARIATVASIIGASLGGLTVLATLIALILKLIA